MHAAICIFVFFVHFVRFKAGVTEDYPLAQRLLSDS